MIQRFALFVSIALLSPFAAAGEPELGSIDFPNSGAPQAQAGFNRAVLLLHSFEYEDARAAFQEAQAADPGFALAHAMLARAYDEMDYSDRAKDSMPARRCSLAGRTPV